MAIFNSKLLTQPGWVTSISWDTAFLNEALRPRSGRKPNGISVPNHINDSMGLQSQKWRKNYGLWLI